MTDAAIPASRKRARRKAGATPEPTTPDAIEIAMDVEASGKPPTSAARAVLERQARLIGWQIASERANFALKVLTGLAGVAAAAVVAVVIWMAGQYRGVTVQPFSTPPDLQAQGLTGATIATRLLDKLTALQADTLSMRAANTFANSWGDDIQVEIPQTGVSAGELWRFLRAWLGEETTISGEVIRTPSGLRISARAGAQSTPLITGSEAELETMLDQVAEAIYARTQPYRYSIYLTRRGRNEDALRTLETLTRSSDATDRKWAYAGWALSLTQAGRAEESIEKANASLAIDPGFGLAYANRSSAEALLGWAEQAYVDNRIGVRNLREGRDVNNEIAAPFVIERNAAVRDAEHDHLSAVALAHAASAQDGVSGRGAWVYEAFARTALHETSGARRSLRGKPLQGARGQLLRDDIDYRGSVALEDWPAAVHAQQRTDAAYAASRAFFEQRYRRRVVQPQLALALARTGRLEEAKATLEGAPTDSYWVVIAKGQVAALSGDVPASERWFAKAAAQAPSLADAEQAWGRARLDRRDLTGAIDQFKAAHRKAPRWADPLKAWGDALALQGAHGAAARQYARAQTFAPRWGALHLAWGRALLAQGRTAEAQAKFRLAATLDLSPKDRAAIDQLLLSRAP